MGDTADLLQQLFIKSGSISLTKPAPPFFLSMTPVKEKDEKITNKFLITNAVERCAVTALPCLDDENDSDEIEIKGVSGVEDGSYSKQTLLALRGVQLQAICKSSGATRGGTKAEMVEKFFFRLTRKEYTDPEVKLVNLLREHQSSRSNIIHQIYKSQFNSQDNFNTCMLAFLPRFTLYNWRTKVLLSLILSQIVNAWAVLQEKIHPAKSDLRSFIDKVSDHWIAKNEDGSSDDD